MTPIRPLAFDRFALTVEVVPPKGADPQPLISMLQTTAQLEIDAFSVATNPVAKARMSAMALCHMLQEQTAKTAILHCTTRDHNRLSLKSLLWGAKALGLQTVIAATGDFVAFKDRHRTTTVQDLDVFDLVRTARRADLQTGVVFDPHPEQNGFEQAVQRLVDKVEAGAQFVVTQPVYAETDVVQLQEALADMAIPIIMGILPLRTPGHADFLHFRVAGIAIPTALRDKMHRSPDPLAEGIANARDMLNAARKHFNGACIMPPFDHYEILAAILD